MFLEFVTWWYSQGWLEAWRTGQKWLKDVEREFSAGILIKTLFSPWKQIVSVPGGGIDEKFRAMMDNLVSRCIGFVVRFLTLISAGVLMLLALIAGLALVIAWPLVPLAFLYSIFRGVAG